MRILFVYGMGRSPLSAWPMLRRLRREGLDTSTFAYGVSRENFPVIRDRLVARIRALAGQGDYVLIGHSLGGVLLRAALNVLPATMAPPCHLFLLGSPVKAARLAARLPRLGGLRHRHGADLVRLPDGRRPLSLCCPCQPAPRVGAFPR